MSALSRNWLAYARGESNAFPWRAIPLKTAASLFGKAERLRRRGYETGWFSSARLPVPTLSIGNITVGGTGKTPCAAWIARYLVSQSRKPAVVSRGYGAKVKEPRVVTQSDGGEEGQWMLDLGDGLCVVEAPQRWAGARMAIDEYGCDSIVLDDGFQHAALERDLDIVLVDATQPWGNGRLLPAGLLRERKEALERADIVILSRADLVEPEPRLTLLREVHQLAPKAVLAAASHRPVRLRSLADDSTCTVDRLAGRKIGLFSAIGNPLAFEKTIQRTGGEIVGHAVFRDHHRYCPKDLKKVLRRFEQADWIVCTAKDAVKIHPLLSQLPEARIWSLDVEWWFLQGEDEVMERVNAILY